MLDEKSMAKEKPASLRLVTGMTNSPDKRGHIVVQVIAGDVILDSEVISKSTVLLKTRMRWAVNRLYRRNALVSEARREIAKTVEDRDWL